MAVTKRVRFEVLRRDNHTCQYCGAKAPDVTLHIDHVMPVALGGDDKPGNLVTACKDCNAGKTSITPDSPLVEGLSDRAASYALGMQDKMTRFRADFEALEAFVGEFHELWFDWTFSSSERENYHQPLPDDYELSLLKWMQIGVPMKAFELAISKAMSKRGVRGEHGRFQYMAGVINRMLDDREIDLTVTSETAAVYTESDADDLRYEGWSKGYDAGISRATREAFATDALRNHIDNTAPEYRGDGAWKTLTGKVVHCGARSREHPS